jgi:hypothetical protein
MANGIYPAIMPNTVAYDVGGGLFSPVNPHINDTLNKRVRWYGKLNPQTATNWCDGATLNPYVAVSGNNTWGAGEQLFGTLDVLAELGTGIVAGGLNVFLPVGNTSNTVSRLRFVWSEVDVATGVAAGQYMELMYLKVATNAVFTPRNLWGPVIPFFINGLATKVWAQHWNFTNATTISFFLGLNGYTTE